MVVKCSKTQTKTKLFAKETEAKGKHEHIFLKFENVELLVEREKVFNILSKMLFKLNNANDFEKLNKLCRE